MSTQPTLAESLGHLARLLLGGLREEGSGRLALRLADDGSLIWRLPASAWDEATQGAALSAMGTWSATERDHGLGSQVELALDLGERTREFQSPNVLFTLRQVASEFPELGFRLELPAGVRDIQRARAGLDSRPPS